MSLLDDLGAKSRKADECKNKRLPSLPGFVRRLKKDPEALDSDLFKVRGRYVSNSEYYDEKHLSFDLAHASRWYSEGVKKNKGGLNPEILDIYLSRALDCIKDWPHVYMRRVNNSVFFQSLNPHERDKAFRSIELLLRNIGNFAFDQYRLAEKDHKPYSNYLLRTGERALTLLKELEGDENYQARKGLDAKVIPVALTLLGFGGAIASFLYNQSSMTAAAIGASGSSPMEFFGLAFFLIGCLGVFLWRGK